MLKSISRTQQFFWGNTAAFIQDNFKERSKSKNISAQISVCISEVQGPKFGVNGVKHSWVLKGTLCQVEKIAG